MRRLVLTSFTPRSWSGGVNRWVQDFMAGFPEAVHYSAWDIPTWKAGAANEWDAARALNQYLIHSKKISEDDIIITDGFWGLGLEKFPNVVSVCHGIWSHLTDVDVARGKRPDNPLHHAIQVDYRTRHNDRGGRMVAVSEFIANQLKLQWHWDVPVINTGFSYDDGWIASEEQKTGLQRFKRSLYDRDKISYEKPCIFHGVNDETNLNKGGDHISLLQKELSEHKECALLSLDDASQGYFEVSVEHRKKMLLFEIVDLVVIPSAYEGNSYFIAECLLNGKPVFSYDVGLMYSARRDGFGPIVGELVDRRERNPERTLEGTRTLIRRWRTKDPVLAPRDYISDFSRKRFWEEWRHYLHDEFEYS